MSEKVQLRKSLIEARWAMSEEQRKRCDAAIGERLLALCASQSARTLGVFWPIQGEPDLRPVYAALSERGMRLALPLVADRHAPLVFSVWQPGDELMKDACGVPVPAVQSSPVLPDAVLVPCVGFNRDLFRIGYGAGYYDRTLAGTHPLQAIGIAYDAAETQFKPAAHDMPLDLIVTESAVLERKDPAAARSPR
jgi:5-formyltetrahydrofolate cyclo-ligase